MKYACVIIMTGFGAGGALFFKKASGAESIKAFFKNYNLYLGTLMFILSAVLNIFLHRLIEYSVLIPLTSLNFVWTYILSYFFLKEKITVFQFIGMGLILTGMVILIVL